MEQISQKIVKEGKEKEVSQRLAKVYENDIKPYTPLVLGKEMVDQLFFRFPKNYFFKVNRKMLIVSDCGLLWSMLQKIKDLNLYEKIEIVFLCHTKEQQEFAWELKSHFNIVIEFLPYKRIKKIIGDKIMNFDFINCREPFDVEVVNPPYSVPQNAKGKRGGGADLWPMFIEFLFNILKKNGHLCAVHPAAWRKPSNNLFKLMTGKQIDYLEIHDIVDGKNTFGVTTRYDWYVIENTDSYKLSLIKDENGDVFKKDLSNVPCIPNAEIEKINSLITKEGEETVEMIHSFSAYETRKPYMNAKETDEYKFLCVSSIRQDGIKYYYSNRNDLGHFGIPKIIFDDSYKMNGVVLDLNGEYGMTQHAMAIVDTPDNLVKIKETLLSPEFEKITKSITFSNYQIDAKIIALFKKDFWKEII